jgi:hypothetical protein
MTEVQQIIEPLHPYLHLLFFIPLLIGLYFLSQLAQVLWEVAYATKPFVDSLPLIVISIIWNAIALTGAWNAAVVPLMIRWLVINGQPTVAKVTELSQRGDKCAVSYSFNDADHLPMTGWTTVTKKVWEQIGAPKELTVLYKQNNPRWNVAYLLSGYEVRCENS